MQTKQKQLNTLAERLIHDTYAPLYLYRKENDYVPVLGEGNPNAAVVFVGEAPGKNEAVTGKPFIGSAGKILDELLQHIKLQRENVYVTSIVQDRPPKNRDPLPAEVTYYGAILLQQLKIIKPRFIATLGRHSMKFIMQTCMLPEATESISVNHGKRFSGKFSYGPATILPLYHPAAALYTPVLKSVMREDIEQLANLIESNKS